MAAATTTQIIFIVDGQPVWDKTARAKMGTDGIYVMYVTIPRRFTSISHIDELSTTSISLRCHFEFTSTLLFTSMPLPFPVYFAWISL